MSSHRRTPALPVLAVCVLGLAACLGAVATPARGQPPGGLTVGKEGELLLNGRPYRGIGINYFDLFRRTLLDGNDAGTLRGLEALGRHGIPFVRFNAGGFWAGEWELYRKDPNEYLRRMDRVVRHAERAGVGLIPSLFWFYAAVPDLVGEPADQWGSSDSRTRAFMREYARRMVGRYKDSPAVWAWEFGNEYNLPADLPNAAQHRPKTNPRAGTPATRTARDDLTGDMIVSAFADFAATVRRVDPHRAILSGNSAPRPYAWHNWKEGSWTLDTPEQYAVMLLRDNPDPTNTLCIHMYPDHKVAAGAAVQKMDELLRVSMEASGKVRKPLFVGEFGAGAQVWKEGQRRMIEAQVRLIEKHRVPLAAAWVFDLPSQEDTHNVTADNDRAYVLKLLKEANERIASAGAAP